MCGLVAMVSMRGAAIATNQLKNMCDIIAHRGPDDAGYLVGQTGRFSASRVMHELEFNDAQFHPITPMIPAIDTPHGMNALKRHNWDVFLGHRRLAILDTSAAGHQPMSDLSRNIWVSYNGEIYNFKSIRTTLETLGYQFITNTDTEVLIYAYHHWGADCVHQFNGMFAFVIWDKYQNKIFIGRDRYGIKPLYYTQLADGTFIFASEIKSILQAQSYQSGLDLEGVYEYFTFQNIFTQKTFYKNISMFPAGHYARIDLKQQNSTLNPRQYWDFSFENPHHVKDKREYEQELDRLFVNGVKRQLLSDVEVGSYLSGGLDSGSITAIAARELPYIKTFTVGFDLTGVSDFELAFDERARAEMMSYHFKTEHYEMILKSGDMERCMEKYVYHLEEPRVGQSYPNYYAAQLASKFVKVVLSGAGGDELFAGYPWRYYRAVVNDDFDHYIDKYYQFWQRLVDNKTLKDLFSSVKGDVENIWTRDIFSNVFKEQNKSNLSPEKYINNSLYFECKTFLHGLLVVEDKLSMAHSLEARVPFLDNDLVDFAQTIPVNLKIANLNKVVKIDENSVGKKTQRHFNKTNDGKLILREVLKKYVPDEITSAVKQGFSSPDQTWFHKHSCEFVEKRILNSLNPIYSVLSFNLVLMLYRDHCEGSANRRLFLWSVIYLSVWYEIFMVPSTIKNTTSETVTCEIIQ